MKNSTRLLLERELQSGMYRYNVGINPVKTISQLFEIYLEEEINSVTHLLETFESKSLNELDFYKFVLDHVEDFGIDSSVIKDYCAIDARNLLINEMGSAIHLRTRYLNKYMLRDKQKFVNIANNIVRPGKLLDVGSGAEFPVSSILFAKERGSVSSMDKFETYWKSLGFLKKLGVEAKSEYFGDKTDVSPYDIIVGQKPCSAINHIVNKCADSDKKEYFIEMCDCESPRNGMEGFVEYLKEKDSRLQSIVVKPTDNSKKIYLPNVMSGITGRDIVYITNSDKNINDLVEIVMDNYK